MVTRSVLLVSVAVAAAALGSVEEETVQATCTDCDGSEDSALLQTISSHGRSKGEDEQALAARNPPYSGPSCYNDITAAQAAWGDAIVRISDSYLNNGDFVETASKAIEELYAYDIVQLPVMFKPTLAALHPFRPTFEGALSYFVGYDAIKPKGFKEDKGFAINGGDGWSKVTFDNDEMSCTGDFSFVHGYYYFTNAQTGAVTGVEYSFGYRRLRGGRSIIFIQTSTLPFEAPPSALLEGKKEEAAELVEEEGKGPNQSICKKDVAKAQKEWGDSILRISKAFPQSDYVKAAESTIDQLYGYDVGPVLFKPTKAEKDPFRPTSIGALSYFVGYDALKPTGFSEDTGFAINGGDGWSKVVFDNDQVFCTDDLGFAQGYYYFTDAKTNVETGVEYTFVYTRQKNHELKIMLHHSSLPFVPPAA